MTFPINRHLTGITNRSGNFAWAPFNAVLPGWSNAAQRVEAVAVRTLLGLDRAAPYDWPVVFALSVLEAYPHVTATLPDPHQTYKLQLYSPPPFRGIVGDLRESAVVGPPSVLIEPKTWPVLYEFTVRRVSATEGVLEVQGATYQVPARQVGGSNVRVEWPTGVGINGLLQYDDWATDAPAVIQYHPLSPARGVLKSVLAEAPALALLHLTGLDVPALTTSDELERFAYVLAALIKTHPLLS